jgi:DNA-binding MarR family transcriptional regulator
MFHTAHKTQKISALSEADYGHLAAFRHELREFLHFSEEAARAAGLHPQQHQALLAIRGNAGCDFITVGELASKLKIKHHSAVGLVARMQKKGLITKTTAPDDRRRVNIGTTSQGKLALKHLSRVHKAELARVGPALRDILTHLRSI